MTAVRKKARALALMWIQTQNLSASQSGGICAATSPHRLLGQAIPTFGNDPRADLYAFNAAWQSAAKQPPVTNGVAVIGVVSRGIGAARRNLSMPAFLSKALGVDANKVSKLDASAATYYHLLVDILSNPGALGANPPPGQAQLWSV